METDPRVWIEDICIGLLLSTICVLGILGNIVTFVVLCYQHQKTRRVIIILFLLGLSVFDTVFLLTWLNFGLRYAQRLFGYGIPSKVFSTQAGAYFGLIVQPFGYIGNVGANTLIVAITLDRFLTVCHPRLSKRYYHNRKCVCVTVSMVILVLSLTMAVLTWASYNVVPAKNEVGYSLKRNDFGKSSELMHFKHWYNSCITMIIPFPILIVFNALIYKKVRDTRKSQVVLTASEVSDISLARMLLCVVLVYGICNTPVMIKAIVVSVTTVDFTKPSDTGHLEEYTSHTIFRIVHWLCIVINASANFIIYCTMSRSFRRALVDLSGIIWSKFRNVKGSGNAAVPQSTKSTNSSGNGDIHVHVSPRA